MMKLILSLTLIWTLSSTAEALDCWQGDGNSLVLSQCISTELCATVAQKGNVDGKFQQSTNRSCEPSSDFIQGKHTYSYNLGFDAISASVHVCNTDGCNNQTIPYPADEKESNLTCFTCDSRSSAVCNKKIKCVGAQDRCISGSAEYEDRTIPTFGCISSNLCERVSILEYFLNAGFKDIPKCCESSFCNSAWSVKLNVITLLFGLITFNFC